MIRLTFKDANPLPFRQWDIEDRKIIRCEPDPEVSWVGVSVPIEEADLFATPFDVHIVWADGSYTALPLDCVMRLPTQTSQEAL